jgi:hypothetical protein
MKLLKGQLLQWCSEYLQLRSVPQQHQNPKVEASLIDYVKTFAKYSRPSQLSVVRALQRQVMNAGSWAACLDLFRVR